MPDAKFDLAKQIRIADRNRRISKRLILEHGARDQAYDVPGHRRLHIDHRWRPDDGVVDRGALQMSTDWRVVIDDTGGPDTGWPSVCSDSEDRTVLHVAGIHQEFWDGPTRKEAMDIAELVANYMNIRGRPPQ